MQDFIFSNSASGTVCVKVTQDSEKSEFMCIYPKLYPTVYVSYHRKECQCVTKSTFSTMDDPNHIGVGASSVWESDIVVFHTLKERKEVMFPPVPICVVCEVSGRLVSQQDYTKTTERICTKLGGRTGHGSRKNPSGGSRNLLWLSVKLHFFIYIYTDFQGNN